MPADAVRFLRKMRGGAQSHLIQASDGHAYVVKFSNNPQHRRILVNEWIASTFLNYLGISAPKGVILNLSADFLNANPEIYVHLGRDRQAVPPGWHFGSRFPGDPTRTVVYDFLPDALLEDVKNLNEFRGVLAFDKWVSNSDSRQAIFFRARLKEWLPEAESHPLRLGFVAQMIDNGFVFDGPHWRLPESPLQGLYFRPLVYQRVRCLDDFEPWLERIRHFPEEVVDEALKQIPREWIAGEEAALEQLMELLLVRRKRVPDLIAACKTEKSNPFPAWPI